MKYVVDSECEVAVVGLGFVGLPAAIMLARAGKKVIGVDINQTLIQRLQAGDCPINEPSIATVFHHPATKSNFSSTNTVPVADTYIIAVPTPLHARKKVAALDALEITAASIVSKLRRGALVIVESTIPPLSCEETIRPILERSGLKVGTDLLLAHCPERLYPGNVADEIINNDRIIGGCNEAANERAIALYGSFVKGKLLATDMLTAEFCKLIENTYRDVNIALVNELAMVAERLGTSIDVAIDLANMHPRVSLLRPGIGVGGHCIPIDPWFIAEVAPEQTELIPAARRINDRMPHVIAGRIRRALAGIPDPLIGVYGVTYKPDVDDQRESPAWEIVRLLREDGYRLDVVDPIAHLGEAKTLLELAPGKDALIVLVPHQRVLSELALCRNDIVGNLRHPILITFGSGSQSGM
jgi:UDP-N-acetyl-D-mannosaminuronic acid dehydrogenase